MESSTLQSYQPVPAPDQTAVLTDFYWGHGSVPSASVPLDLLHLPVASTVRVSLNDFQG